MCPVWVRCPSVVRRKREVNVYCDPNKLDAYNLSVETISSIISAENRNTPGGTFDVGSNTYSLRVEGEFKDPNEMENIVVGTHNGASVYLRDVAKLWTRGGTCTEDV